VSKPVPDRDVIERALDKNKEITKVLKRQVKVSADYHAAITPSTEEEYALLPVTGKVTSQLGKLNDEAKLLRRQLKLIDDYDGHFGEKKDSPVAKEEPVAVAG